MYLWRTMTAEERCEVLKERIVRHHPWHGPPHITNDNQHYMITAACYEHRPVIGASSRRMGEFESELVELLTTRCDQVFRWIVLPNHYHALVRATDLKAVLASVGLLHGRTSHRWNGDDRCRGRKVWYRVAETGIKSESHFWASLNYILNNAVRHGYVERWQDWPYCNASGYLEGVGREEAERRWKKYPLLDFGRDWDPPDL
jgi:putative transposase